MESMIFEHRVTKHKLVWRLSRLDGFVNPSFSIFLYRYTITIIFLHIEHFKSSWTRNSPVHSYLFTLVGHPLHAC